MIDRGKKALRWLCQRPRQRRSWRRYGLVEPLEARRLLAILEGGSFSVSEVFDNSGLAGTLTASIDWGDGVVTVANASGGGGGSLVGRVDYSLDTNNFFDTQLKKDLFQQAVDTVLSRLGDDLAQIAPSGANTWTAIFVHPGTGASLPVPNLQVAANEILIYAGGRELGGSLGAGGPGGFNVSCVDSSFCETVSTRGEPGASGQSPTDFGLWGGSISLDISTDFFFSPTIEGIQSSQSDFLSVAIHEVTHLLGFGTSGAWNTYRSGNVFNGPISRAAYGGTSVPLADGGSHWLEGTSVDGQETAMDTSLTTGTRKLLTPLDLAGLDDIGWELITTNSTVTGSHVYGDDGEYDVVVTLAGSDGGSITKTLQLTVLPLSWHNATLRWDVDGDEHVSPIDALRIVNDLNSRGARELFAPELGDVPPYLDVNDDGHVSPLDVLQVVNYLNNGFLNSAGEAPTGDMQRRSTPSSGGATMTSELVRPYHQAERRKSEREIVFFSHQLGDALSDDLIADIAAALNRPA